MRATLAPHLALLSALALTACGPDRAAEGGNSAAQQTRITELELELNTALAANELLNARARIAPAIAAPVDDAPMDDIPLADQHIPAPLDMCYKDYCPCDPPQGGPDTVLCDQLEEGRPVQVDMMIAGRGMREARRQLEEFDSDNF